MTVANEDLYAIIWSHNGFIYTHERSGEIILFTEDELSDVTGLSSDRIFDHQPQDQDAFTAAKAEPSVLFAIPIDLLNVLLGRPHSK